MLLKAGSYDLGYIDAIGDEKRELLKSIGSNSVATEKSIDFPMDFPFAAIRNWHISTHCEPRHRQVRISGDLGDTKHAEHIRALINRLRDERPTDLGVSLSP
jgi:hypothetical protein